MLGLFNYEFAYGLHPRLAALLRPAHTMFRALAFKRHEILTGTEIDAWLAKHAPHADSPSGIAASRLSTRASRNKISCRPPRASSATSAPA